MLRKQDIEFYSSTTLKSYNLDKSMRYQLNMLGNLDIMTRKHCENVANLTCRMCEYLHAKELFTIHATTCAYLHDIGKIFIPLEILQKPGPLTDEEYEIMKTHTTIGYNMCMNDLKLRPYAGGPLYHHECLDGSGYPHGLTKKDIPYYAQIIHIADVFDAIVSKRHYKSHINISDTLRILLKDAMPSRQSIALDVLSRDSKVGKISMSILKVLFKVVIDDTLYEISCVMEYENYLKEQLKRLDKIAQYGEKAERAKKESQKEYYQSGMIAMFEKGENFDNYKQVIADYKEALEAKQNIIKSLYHEIEIIKKLKK